LKLSTEQENIIKAIEEGKDVFVDACIGAGKTTLLNAVCETFNRKRILYLTYNKLLKEDAKNKINSANAEVLNYHGFAYKYLIRGRIRYTNQDGIKEVVKNIKNGLIKIPQYDMILIDEYQDINNDASDLIFAIEEEQKKEVQLVFVGDMKQKIYDTTTIDVLNDCIFKLRKEYTKLDLTQCFRLNEDHASMLGKIWKKTIKGVNKNQKVLKIKFDQEEVEQILDEYENKDILILTPFKNNIELNNMINHLEKTNPEKYNKKNLYVTISDNESNLNKPIENSMIVTTFDGSKGLERKLAIVFGFEEDVLQFRSERANKQIITNLFLVAASRGKEKIIFVESGKSNLLNAKNFEYNLRNRIEIEEYNPNDMFDFCFDKHLEMCMEELIIEEIPQKDTTTIETLDRDYNILLSPAMGNYQEAMFFHKWKFEKALSYYREDLPITKYIKKASPKQKIKQILALTALETNLMRYFNQAITEFIEIDEEVRLIERMETHLSRNAMIQIAVEDIINRTSIRGSIDCVQNDIPYELKFVEELEKKHFLQIATYMYLGNYRVGRLWNTKKNQLFEIKIKNKYEFIEKILKTIKKG
jgi:hypothetical protein